MNPEFVNTQETGISDDYVYLHCRCEYPLEFGWRFPRTDEEIIFTCPKCKTKMGMIGTKTNKGKGGLVWTN